jgi:oligopeptidase B
MKNTLVRTALCVIFASSFTNTKAQQMSNKKSNSVAKIIPKSLEKHNETRIDNYFWLNDRETEVIDYLNKENTYYDAMTAHTKDFQKNCLRK